MTDRIYYTDPYCRSFDAQLTRMYEHDGRPAIVLDRTAFYPTSGGQPHDIGTLGEVSVIDVVDLGDEIAHVLAQPVRLEAGSRVTGAIDWSRRFDHMQQHTGQHVLSAAFDRTSGNPTMSFHMGTEESTIDLEREVSAADIERAVDEANRVVWDDRAVSIRFVSADQAAALPLRKEPSREGPLRLIEVADFDLSACGGSHVSRTGAIGLIAVTRHEKFRGGTRLSFVCGARALTTLRGYRDAVAGAVRVLSVTPNELAAAIERAHTESRDLRKTIKALQEQLATHEASRLRASAREVAGVRVVVDTLDGWDANGLKAIAAAIVATGQTVAVLTSATSPLMLVIARSADVAVDANSVLKTLLQAFGGRGGGKPELAQAGGLLSSAKEATFKATTVIESYLAAS